MSQSMKVTVSDEGIKVDAGGFKNGQCLVEMEQMLKYLKSIGIETSDLEQKMKSEAYIGAGMVKNTLNSSQK